MSKKQIEYNSAQMKLFTDVVFQSHLQTIHKLASKFSNSSDSNLRRLFRNSKSAGQDFDGFIKKNFSKIIREEENQNTIAKSLFILVFSYIEDYFNSLCAIYKEDDPSLVISLNDINGKGITRAKIYLEKVIKLPNFISNSEWEKLTLLTTLRNKIVHAGSFAEKDLSKKIEKFYNVDLIRISDNEQILLSIQFVKEFIDEFHISFLKRRTFDYILKPKKPRKKKSNDA
ncbi:hypothetical protein [Leptospira johnsonii]|uniref:RiboL-PSP-HEPN domain-containing protein n=1 Tax=Leptospira johnsonii TaxID=1917820 RepID=A0A2P2D7Y3_9LEPT|nr:hypothetical protein [Leptospira johnsonii]GBF40728.1 hypothetical protein LPTSP1_37460 [Leptospira johnsonii]